MNARSLISPEIRGWTRYTINLLSELSKMGHSVYLYSDSPIHESHLHTLNPSAYTVKTSSLISYDFWEQFWLPNQCYKDKINILHSPTNFGLPTLSPCPRVLTLHDAIQKQTHFPHSLSGAKLKAGSLRDQFRHWQSRSVAEKIITVSEYSKSDIVRKFSVPETKLSVIYEAADYRFSQALTETEMKRTSEKYQLPSSYVFYLGGFEERKNIPFLIQSFAISGLNRTHLVLAGASKEEESEIQKLAAKLQVSHQTKILGKIEDQDLPALYSGALCFVYPSSHEGFGLQLCEAMASGCPTLAADGTSLKEILGAGGESFSLDQPRELASILLKVEADPRYRSTLKERAKARSSHFSFRKMAEQTELIYFSLLNPKR